MNTIIKNEDGNFWVRCCGIYVGTFATYKEAKKVVGRSEELADDTIKFERKSKPISDGELSHPNIIG